MNVKSYLKRINFKGELTPTLEVLKELQKTHLLNVPFENLDIHYNNSIVLDVNKIYHKIVEDKRGGFCYELNGLFYELLKAIGFQTKIISARVYNAKTKSFGQEYDHMALLVKINEQEYIVDVGFGEFVFHPLKFELTEVLHDPRGDFIIEEYDRDYFKISKIIGGEKSPEYIFKKVERSLEEFSGMCFYHQTSSDSHFTHKKLISRPTENGRITITGNTLKISEAAAITTQEFSEEEFGAFLKEWFALDEVSLVF